MYKWFLEMFVLFYTNFMMSLQPVQITENRLVKDIRYMSASEVLAGR